MDEMAGGWVFYNEYFRFGQYKFLKKLRRRLILAFLSKKFTGWVFYKKIIYLLVFLIINQDYIGYFGGLYFL